MTAITGRLQIEPLNVEGAYVFFIADEHSFGLLAATIFGTKWQKEFESDFNFFWKEKSGLTSNNFEVTLASDVHKKWFKRATCRLDNI